MLFPCLCTRLSFLSNNLCAVKKNIHAKCINAFFGKIPMFIKIWIVFEYAHFDKFFSSVHLQESPYACEEISAKLASLP